MKSRHLFCLSALLLIPTLSARAQSTSTDAAPASAPHPYKFEVHQVTTPGGSTEVYVELSDTNDPTFHRHVLDVLSGVHAMTRTQRAVVIAARMQALRDANPEWPQSLRVVQLRGECVVTDGKSGKSIITADQGSVRMANATSAEKYAAMMIRNIQERLAGIKLR